MEDDRYEKLRVAVQDLLSELRIDEECLKVMAKGYSPDYPGSIRQDLLKSWVNPYCKVQLSSVVAQKLIGAGVLPLQEGSGEVKYGGVKLLGCRECGREMVASRDSICVCGATNWRG